MFTMQPFVPLFYSSGNAECLGMLLPTTDLNISADPEHVCFVVRIELIFMSTTFPASGAQCMY